ISHLGELGLDERLEKVVSLKKLYATTNTKDAVSKSDVSILIVPTPITKDKEPDLSYVGSAGFEVKEGLRKGHLIILESTVYPGVTEEVLQPILESTGLKAGIDFGIAYCPERYNPGDSEHTIENVRRIVGGINDEWGEITKDLYAHVIKAGVTKVRDIKTAEAAKVIENIQRDLNIALMNELSLIFEKMGIDIIDVIKAASTKWNFNVYYPGAGVGGHCLPVDPYYLVAKARGLGYHSKVITAGRAINDHMPQHIFELLRDSLNDMEKPVKNSNVVVLGFSYKENVGDARETPVEHLVQELLKSKADVTVVDPFVEESFIKSFGVKVEHDPYNALKHADALVLMTGHQIFRELDLEKVKKLMNLSIIIDGRRTYDKEKVLELGFTYRGVGAGY
ncbi:MAG: nucleotide sugar dehydrogenase, partial [Bacteroidales bacterium]|nr:nucleotide sugar dehydrogenase [Bacteroidales bacterium]